jgi:penicillin-binding protein 1C
MLKKALRITACWRLLLALAPAWALPALAWAVPSYDEVKAQYAASDILIQDRHGRLLERIRTDLQGRRGDWVALDDVSAAMQRAVILSEDRKFFAHDGVDWQALGAAAWGAITQERQRGASTLTMQLLGLIDGQYQRGPGGRSFVQKIDQVLEAQKLESVWSKQQILEAYFNLVAFRGELIGIDALSRIMFQKRASGLDVREAALAAILLRGPNAAPSTLLRRACQLLGEMGWPEQCDGLDGFVYRALSRMSASWADSASLAPHFGRLAWERARAPGLDHNPRIRTSLDAGLQGFTLSSVAEHVRSLARANVRDAAVVVLDNHSGEVLAYVGSSGGLSRASSVDHARALRQAGSTLKPFLYAQALEQQRLTAASLLMDGPLDLATGNGLYIPQNYDKQYAGWVSVRTALASSLNVPAVRVLTMVTPDAFARRLVQLGLPLDESGDFYGYSLALGSADVSLLALTNAYRTLASGGRYSPPVYLGDDAAPARGVQVMSTDAAWIIGDILSDRQARARTFGLDSPLSTPFWTAVKTGTSKDMRDNWCIGWSERYTVGVWVGNSGGASMQDVSGVSGAGPIWHDIMTYLHRSTGSKQSLQPATVVRAGIDFQHDLEPPRSEVFLADTAIAHVALAPEDHQGMVLRPHIASPADGVVLALDPDIPPARQRVRLRAAATAQMAHTLAWRVDGTVLGQGATLLWGPRPGKHQVELLDEDGRVLDHVRIDVRGAGIRPAAQ